MGAQRASWLVGSLLALGACARPPACLEPGCEGESGTVGETEGDERGSVAIGIFAEFELDILLVIDNSDSMGEVQARLVRELQQLIAVLESEGLSTNYRIGLTTTDNGNPWCSEQTAAKGRLIASSCEDRLDDFVLGDTDARDIACRNLCELDGPALEILPTTTDYDTQPKPRPWLERIDRQTNLPASTDLSQALACIVPQGIVGCGFESPLESMYQAIEAANTPSSNSYGFIRPTSIFAVVIVTDEADCSFNQDYASIFDANGDQVFWSDPAGPPSSAICWNAGVECDGDPSGYSSCDPVNKGVDGGVVVADELAVLHPVRRYTSQLQALEDSRKLLDPDNEIIVTLIAGVGDDGQAHYADASDPLVQDSFGIGPGCEGTDPDTGALIQAVPPVRLLELSEAFTAAGRASICHGDYTEAFVPIVRRIEGQIQPACHPQCVRDTNPDTAILEPDCVVELDPPGNANLIEVPECLRDADGYVVDIQTLDYAMPSDDTDACFALLVDEGLTPDTADDLSAYCLDRHYNLELKLALRPDFPTPSGTTASASCVLAEQPEASCPGLGG